MRFRAQTLFFGAFCGEAGHSLKKGIVLFSDWRYHWGLMARKSNFALWGLQSFEDMRKCKWRVKVFIPPWDSPGKNTGAGCHSLLQGMFPRPEPWSPALQADSLSSEPPGKSKKENICKLFLSSDFRYSDGLGQGFYCPHLRAGPQESFDWQVRQWSGLWLPGDTGCVGFSHRDAQFPMGHSGETSAWYKFGWASGWGQGAT